MSGYEYALAVDDQERCLILRRDELPRVEDLPDPLRVLTPPRWWTGSDVWESIATFQDVTVARHVLDLLRADDRVDA